MPYYYQVEKLSNIYAYQIGLGGQYGHGFKTVKISENKSMMDAFLGMVSGVDPVVQFIGSGRWSLNTVITLHKGLTIGAGFK